MWQEQMPKLSKAVGVVFLVILLSRILLPSISPAFFDSPEYLRLFENANFFDSLRQVHNPIHPLFLLVFWLFNKVPLGTTLLRAEFLNGILGFLTMVVIYKISRSLIVTVFIAFLPYFWLSQVNLLYEPLLIFLLGLSVYYLKNIRLAALFFALAFLVSTTALIYLLPLLAWIWIKQPRQLLPAVFVFGVYLLGGSLVYGLITSPAGLFLNANSPLNKMMIKGWLFFPRVVRNMVVIYFNYLTIPLGLVCLWLGLRKKNLVLLLAWLVAFFLANSIWHAGMFGRLSLGLTILPVFLISQIKNRFFLAGLFLLLLVQSIKLVVPYHFQEIPYWQEKKAVANLAGDPLLIISNYEEPYLQGKFNYLVLNSPQTDEIKIRAAIVEAKNHQRTVLITPQVVTTPYFQYDGLSFHLLSQGQNHPETLGQKLMAEFDLETLMF